MQLNISSFSKFFNLALLEDLGINGDITSESIISSTSVSNFKLIAKQNLILCGSEIFNWYCSNYGIVDYKWNYYDGQPIPKNSVIVEGISSTKTILLLERVMLNFLQHLSGIATFTNKFVQETIGTKAKISDTRKT
ncbi:MAG: nicotinate-nucleotide diphosphorylase (carboxylating), partial [Rickettsiaceae bacterium]|nr:nicotinate-nucleotide diphosphorylase (carboxylating) [Rickettsiaceae bacterium]